MLSPSTRQQPSPARNSLPIKNACASPSGDGCTAYCSLMPHCSPIAQQLLKPRRVLRRRDHQDLPNPRQHQRRQRIVDHRLVIHRQQLLGHRLRHRMQPRPRAARKNNPLHREPSPAAIVMRSRRQHLHSGPRAAVVLLHPLLIRPARHTLHPRRIRQIPLHRLAQPSLKALLRPPAQLALQLPRVDRIPPVMPRPVRHILHQLQMRPELRLRHQLIQQRAQRRHHLQIAPLISSADVVRLAHAPSLQHRPHRPAMVPHIQPVPHLLPIAIHRQRLALQRIRNHQRNQLLRKLIRPIVIRAVRNHRRQPVGMHPRPHQVIRRRLRRRIRTVRRIRRLLMKRRILRRQRSVHLIGRHMQKPKPRPAPPRPANRSTRAPPAAE